MHSGQGGADYRRRWVDQFRIVPPGAGVAAAETGGAGAERNWAVSHRAGVTDAGGGGPGSRLTRRIHTQMSILSKLTRLPRALKTLILVCVDAVLAAAFFWLAAVVRVGGIPVVPVRQALFATILVMMLVPAIGIACGLYRPVIRFHNPRLPMRAGMVGALSGAAIAAVAWAGNSGYLDAVGIGVVFALMLFAGLISSRHVARWLLGVGGTLEGTPVAIYGAGAAGRQLVAMFRRSREFRPAIFIDDDPSLHHRIVETLGVLSPKD